MTLHEQEQAKALKLVVVDAKLVSADDWDHRFITSMDYIARQQQWLWLKEGQQSQLRRLVGKYADELTAAGLRHLIFTEPMKTEAKK